MIKSDYVGILKSIDKNGGMPKKVEIRRITDTQKKESYYQLYDDYKKEIIGGVDFSIPKHIVEFVIDFFKLEACESVQDILRDAGIKEPDISKIADKLL